MQKVLGIGFEARCAAIDSTWLSSLTTTPKVPDRSLTHEQLQAVQQLAANANCHRYDKKRASALRDCRYQLN